MCERERERGGAEGRGRGVSRYTLCHYNEALICCGMIWQPIKTVALPSGAARGAAINCSAEAEECTASTNQNTTRLTPVPLSKQRTA